MSPVLEQLAGEFARRLKLVKVNADEAPGLSQRFDVQAIPTLILLERGEVIDKQVGRSCGDFALVGDRKARLDVTTAWIAPDPHLALVRPVDPPR